jgi:hypothetical protein
MATASWSAARSSPGTGPVVGGAQAGHRGNEEAAIHTWQGVAVKHAGAGSFGRGVARVTRRDVQIAAQHTDPHTTMRYDVPQKPRPTPLTLLVSEWPPGTEPLRHRLNIRAPNSRLRDASSTAAQRHPAVQ